MVEYISFSLASFQGTKKETSTLLPVLASLFQSKDLEHLTLHSIKTALVEKTNITKVPSLSGNLEFQEEDFQAQKYVLEVLKR